MRAQTRTIGGVVLTAATVLVTTGEARNEGKDLTLQITTKYELTTPDGTETRGIGETLLASTKSLRVQPLPTQEPDGSEAPAKPVTNILLDGGATIVTLFDSMHLYSKVDLQARAAMSAVVTPGIVVHTSRQGTSCWGVVDGAAIRAGRALSEEGELLIIDGPTVSDVSVTVDGPTQGPTIEGFPTTHYTVRQHAVLKVTVRGEVQSESVDVTTDYLASAELEKMLKRFPLVQREVIAAYAMNPTAYIWNSSDLLSGLLRGNVPALYTRTGGAFAYIDPAAILDCDSIWPGASRNALAKVPRTGLLRGVRTRTLTVEGQAFSTVMTTELGKVRLTALPASTWEIPADYRRMGGDH